jgi:hypothetical protein
MVPFLAVPNKQTIHTIAIQGHPGKLTSRLTVRPFSRGRFSDLEPTPPHWPAERVHSAYRSVEAVMLKILREDLPDPVVLGIGPEVRVEST